MGERPPGPLWVRQRCPQLSRFPGLEPSKGRLHRASTCPSRSAPDLRRSVSHAHPRHARHCWHRWALPTWPLRSVGIRRGWKSSRDSSGSLSCELSTRSHSLVFTPRRCDTHGRGHHRPFPQECPPPQSRGQHSPRPGLAGLPAPEASTLCLLVPVSRPGLCSLCPRGL